MTLIVQLLVLVFVFMKRCGERGELDLNKENTRLFFFFFTTSPASATKLLLTNTRVVWLRAFVDLELKVQAGHGSWPVFQCLPIYFGKKVLVLGSGQQTAPGRKQEGTIFGALFEKANHLNPQWENNTCNYTKLLGFLRRRAITRHDLASRKVITITI